MYLEGGEIRYYQEVADVLARKAKELEEKAEYWRKEAVKNAAELGEIKIKEAQTAACGIQGVLNSLPSDLIGKRVWICYCNIILRGNIQSYEVGNEGVKVMVGTDKIGCVERKPEDIYDTAMEIIKIFRRIQY